MIANYLSSMDRVVTDLYVANGCRFRSVLAYRFMSFVCHYTDKIECDKTIWAHTLHAINKNMASFINEHVETCSVIVARRT
jgi:hypothetical protein